MHTRKKPNPKHGWGFCKTCRRITYQDVHFDVEERQHFVCCECGSVTHSQKRPK